MSEQTEAIGVFLEIAREIERRAGAWRFMATEGPEGEGEEWTCGSTLPDRAAEAIRQQAKYLDLAQQVIDEERRKTDAAMMASKVFDAAARRFETALRSIAANTCCDSCREAALVAKEALRGRS